jgi:hypothetical protein
MKRIAIVVDRDLPRGAVGNVAAILMGQAALCRPDIYHTEDLLDQSGNRHAAIQYSTVLLSAGRGQLINLVERIRSAGEGLTWVLFTELGQGLHNAYPEYQARVRSSTTADLGPVGLVLVGEDEAVRAITRKYSVLKD